MKYSTRRTSKTWMMLIIGIAIGMAIYAFFGDTISSTTQDAISSIPEATSTSLEPPNVSELEYQPGQEGYRQIDKRACEDAEDDLTKFQWSKEGIRQAWAERNKYEREEAKLRDAVHAKCN